MSGALKRLWSDLDGSTYFPRKRIHNALVQFLGFRGQSQPLQSTNWPGRLPDDILLQIFTAIIEDYFSHSDALFASTAIPQITLGRVCRQWRLALHDIRSAWISIPTGLSPRQVWHSAQQARGLPLRIGIEFCLPDLSSKGSWSRARLQQELIRQFDTRFNLATLQVEGEAVEFGNVRELAVSAPSHVLSELAAQNLWRKRRFPHVDTLHVAVQVMQVAKLPKDLQDIYRDAGRTTTPSLLWTRSFPSLRQLRLDGVELPHGFMGIPEGLRHLELNMTSRCQRDMTAGVSPPDVGALSYIFPKLRALPHLEYLSVDFADISVKPSVQETNQASATTLHSLREINLAATSTFPLEFMAYARLPALRRCTLNFHYSNNRDPGVIMTAAELETPFVNFFRQLAAAGVHLRSVYLGYHHCPTSMKAVVSIMASTETIDWTDAASVRSFSENANLNCTISWDPDTHRSDGMIAYIFLDTLLHWLPSHVSDTHLIDTLVFIDDHAFVSEFCYATLLECAPYIHTLAYYGRDKAMLDALGFLGDESKPQYAPWRLPKTLIFEGVDGERRLDVSRRFGARLEPAQVRFAGSEPARVLREAVMKTVG